MVDRITLFYTPAWGYSRFMEHFKFNQAILRQFEVVIPMKAHSGGTLISLGADVIVMTNKRH